MVLGFLESMEESPVTLLLIMAFFLVFANQINLALTGGTEAVNAFVETYAFELGAMTTGEYYRFLTHVFVHGGVAHLVFNSLVLLVTGKPLERRLGSGVFLLLFSASALAGASASLLFLGQGELAIGASAGIMGVMAAATLLVPTDSMLEELPVVHFFSLPIIRSLFSVVLLGLFFIFQETVLASLELYRVSEVGIGRIAHLGGLITGLGIAYLLDPREAVESIKFSAATVVLLAALFLLPPLTPYWYGALALLVLLLIYWRRKERNF